MEKISLSPKNENLEEIKNKIKEKYFTRLPQSGQFSRMGDVKIVGDKIFFVYRDAHETREHGNRHDILVILDKNMKELGNFSGERYTSFDTINPKYEDKNFSRPRFEFKQIGEIDGNKVTIINGEDNPIVIDLTETYASHGKDEDDE